jgi:hypothetical protein
MARGQTELIDFLLAEIASGGQHGASSLPSSGLPQICPIVPVEIPSVSCKPQPPFHLHNHLLVVTDNCMIPRHAQNISTINNLGRFR